MPVPGAQRRLQPEAQHSRAVKLTAGAACSALAGAQPRVVSYEEQVTQLREQLADLYALEEDFTKAAQLLAGIDLDSGACKARALALQCLMHSWARASWPRARPARLVQSHHSLLQQGLQRGQGWPSHACGILWRWLEPCLT